MKLQCAKFHSNHFPPRRFQRSSGWAAYREANETILCCYRDRDACRKQRRGRLGSCVQPQFVMPYVKQWTKVHQTSSLCGHITSITKSMTGLVWNWSSKGTFCFVIAEKCRRGNITSYLDNSPSPDVRCVCLWRGRERSFDVDSHAFSRVLSCVSVSSV